MTEMSGPGYYHIKCVSVHDLITDTRNILWNPMLSAAQREVHAKVRIKINNNFNKHGGDIMRNVMIGGRR